MFGQLLVSGIAQGAIYALLALGMTAVFRASTVVNFGHGDLLMGGSFLIYVMVVDLSVPFLLAMPLALVAMFVLGVAIHRWLIVPVENGPPLSLSMMAIAVGFALRGGATLEWGQSILPFPRIYPDKAFFLGSVIINLSDLIIVAAVTILLLALWAVFAITPIGRTARAVFQSRTGAALVGINVPSFQGGIWGIGAALAAFGGALIAPITLLYPDMAASGLIRGFAAMTLGGFGSFPGAVVGGFLLGIMEMMVGGYVSSSFVDITAYVTIIAVLLIRPVGLFGRKDVVRV